MFRNVLGFIFALMAIACFPLAQYYSKQFKRSESSPSSYAIKQWRPYCLEKDKQCGYKDRYNNKLKISLVFEETHPFTSVQNQHVALVRSKGKYGYIDAHGKFLLPPIYTKATGFWNNYAWVKADKDYQKINLLGRVIKQTAYDYFVPETEGPAENIAVYGKNGKYGLLNLKSEQIITKPLYDFIGPFSKRAVAAVKQNGRYGMIHFDGRLMIKPSYQHISFPNPNDYEKDSYNFARICRAIIKKDGKYDVLNVGEDSFIQDSYHFSAKYDEIKLPGTNGISKIAKQNKFGYFNFDSGQILKPRFEDASEMIDGISIVKIDGKYGVMNQYGALVIYPNMDKQPVLVKKRGVILIKNDNKYGLLRNGELKVKPLYDEIKCWEVNDSESQYYAVRQGQNWGILNSFGVQTTALEYETASCGGTNQVNVLKEGKIISLNSNGEKLYTPKGQAQSGLGFVNP